MPACVLAVTTLLKPYQFHTQSLKYDDDDRGSGTRNQALLFSENITSPLFFEALGVDMSQLTGLDGLRDG